MACMLRHEKTERTFVPMVVLQPEERGHRCAPEPSSAPSLPLAALRILSPISPRASPSPSGLIKPNPA